MTKACRMRTKAYILRQLPRIGGASFSEISDAFCFSDMKILVLKNQCPSDIRLAKSRKAPGTPSGNCLKNENPVKTYHPFL